MTRDEMAMEWKAKDGKEGEIVTEWKVCMRGAEVFS